MSEYDPETIEKFPAVIANGATESAEVNLLGNRMAGVFIPNTFEGTSISILARDPSGTFVPVDGIGTGSAYAVQVGVSKYIPFDIMITAGLREIKLKSNVAVAAVRTLTIQAREF